MEKLQNLEVKYLSIFLYAVEKKANMLKTCANHRPYCRHLMNTHSKKETLRQVNWWCKMLHHFWVLGLIAAAF